MLNIINISDLGDGTWSGNLVFLDRRNGSNAQIGDIVTDPVGTEFYIKNITVAPESQGQSLPVVLEPLTSGIAPVTSLDYRGSIREFSNIKFDDTRFEYEITAADVLLEEVTLTLQGLVYVPGSGDLEIFQNGVALPKGTLSAGDKLEEAPVSLIPGSTADYVKVNGTLFMEGDLLMFIKERVEISRRFYGIAL